MALASTEVTPSSYVLIGNDVTSITFQCQSSTPVVISVSTSGSGIATATDGLIYNRFEGEVKKLVADLSFETNPKFVYAKALTGTSKIVYETP